jgi:glycosyltransferase involved in cell wall biosynthesis
MSASLPSVSVIMPAWNEAATIGEQIEALARQEDVTPLEIVVADNGSTDATLEIVDSYRERLPQLRWIVADAVKGPSHARNEGAKVATGDVLAFCDSDDVVDDRWLVELLRGLEGADLVSGPLSTVRLNDSVRIAWRPTDQHGPPRAGSFLPIAVTSNLAIRRGLFLRVGMFDESFTRGEDDEFSYRLQLSGYTYSFVPTAVVHNRLRSSVRALMRREFQDEVASAHLFAVFGARGYPRASPIGVLKHWAWLLVHVVDLRRRATGGRWLRKAAGAVGRIRGSIRYRVIYL